MEARRRIKGYTFEWNEADTSYECRGEVCYDEEHDEVPDPDLWKATTLLEDDLIAEGFKAEASHSEKGWQEVNVEL